MLVSSKPFISIPQSDEESVSTDIAFAGKFYSSGSLSLVHALKKLEVEEGSKIGVPGFFCSSALDALLDNGFEVVFFDISDCLEPELEALKSFIATESIDVLLVVHYFGITQPSTSIIREFAQKNGVVVIEDYCHSFLSFENLPKNWLSDAYILSFRKLVPTLDFGKCIVPSAQDVERSEDSSLAVYRLKWQKAVIIQLERMIIKFGWPNLYGRRISSIKTYVSKIFKSTMLVTNQNVFSGGEILVSGNAVRSLMDTVFLKEIASRRVENYTQLLEACEDVGLKPILTRVLNSDIPQVLPVKDNTKSLLPFLRNCGIGAYAWPGEDIPLIIGKDKEKFPKTLDANRTIVCLPVHHDLSVVQINYIIKMLNTWVRLVD